MRRRLALDGGIDGQHHLLDRAACRPLDQLVDRQVLRAAPPRWPTACRPARDRARSWRPSVRAPTGRRPPRRRRAWSGRGAGSAHRVHGIDRVDIAAFLAHLHLVARLRQRVRQRRQQLLAVLDEKQRGAPRRPRPEPRQSGQQLDQPIDFRPGGAPAHASERQLEPRRQRQAAGDRLASRGPPIPPSWSALRHGRRPADPRGSPSRSRLEQARIDRDAAQHALAVQLSPPPARRRPWPSTVIASSLACMSCMLGLHLLDLLHHLAEILHRSPRLIRQWTGLFHHLAARLRRRGCLLAHRGSRHPGSGPASACTAGILRAPPEKPFAPVMGLLGERLGRRRRTPPAPSSDAPSRLQSLRTRHPAARRRAGLERHLDHARLDANGPGMSARARI